MNSCEQLYHYLLVKSVSTQWITTFTKPPRSNFGR